MDKLFQECFLSRLSDTGSVFPFFWQHGEPHAVLKEEMDAIRASGATEFCVESRVHPNFGRDEWWDDFRFMLDYAREHGMRVWLLDDKRFPTGYANGWLETHPELRRRVLRLVYRDMTGPTRGTMICAPELDASRGEEFVSITAWKRAADFRSVVGQPVDLTDRVGAQGRIDWQIPRGTWRVYYVIASTGLPTGKLERYIDMLNPESAKAMLHAVYEPHYEHFKEYFGNTFRGFFSDEPGFANGTECYTETVGTEDIPFPWRADLPEMIGREIGRSAREVRLRLACLWHTLPGIAPAVRAGYMDSITRLYRENFSDLLGNWCRERNVLYIGHVIEDLNTHQRLGFGAGHYFRALRGQDMSGVDIVLNQIVPGNTDVIHTGPVSGKLLDPEFFHYALAKLASSAAHLQPEKENRAMAEVFGAFGWSEGVGYMKYLADHMLACGINHFVPHAFSPEYPDLDCPPHFHARGKNPQEPAFGLLIRYMQKVARLTAESVHRADVAVLYNPQAEWTGGKHDYIQQTGRRLTQNQIDYDIIPEDILYDAHAQNGVLTINRETYHALIVPYSQILPDRILQTLARLQDEGLPVIYEKRAPSRSASGVPARKLINAPCVVAAEKLTAYLREKGWFRVTAAEACPCLRVYEVDRGEEKIFLLFNEGADAIDTRVTFRGAERPLFYDAWNNTVRKPDVRSGAVRIKLAPWQAIVLISGGDTDALLYDYHDKPLRPLAARWTIRLRDAGTEAFRVYGESDRLIRFNVPEREPDFCGTIRYETVFDADGETTLDLGAVGEIATVFVNGKNCGTAVAAPYVFDVSKAVVKGKNELRVDVVNSPVYREQKNDEFVTYSPMPLSGLLGPVALG